MTLIGIETAGEACSVALWQAGQVTERFELAPRRQTERVLPMVQALLDECGLAPGALDGVVFGQGPGAFTGVRVAVAVAQGLGYALDRPVLGVSTLASAALAAFDAGAEGPLLTVFDARMGELYLAVHERLDRDRLQVLVPDQLVRPGRWPAFPVGIRDATGSGQAHAEALSTVLPGLRRWVGDGHPRAGTLVRLAAPVFAEQAGPAAQARPVYLRDQVVQGAQRD